MIADYTAAEVAAEVALAEERIRPYIRETPLEHSPFLSAQTNCEVFLKMENLQVTNSFKARGAFSALLALSSEERERGVVTSSTGNHANACAYAMPLLGIDGEIWVPANASRAKLDQLKARGAKLVLIDDDPGKVEVLARAEADRTGHIFVSPYNDPRVVGGQGTIAVEVLRQLGRARDAVFVPVGGGSLIAGIAGYFKANAAHTEVVGCLPSNSPVMSECAKAGREMGVPCESSLSDATVGSFEPGSITFPICRDCVNDWVLVSEDEIAAAIRTVVACHSVLVEGAGALSVASLLKEHEYSVGRTVVLVLSGARIPLDKLAGVLADRV